MALGRDKAGSLIVQAIMDIEKTFPAVSVEIFLADSSMGEFLRCSREFGEVIKPESKEAKAYRQNHDIQLNRDCIFHASRICRHGFMLILYRGQISVVQVSNAFDSEFENQQNSFHLDNVIERIACKGDKHELNTTMNRLLQEEASNPSFHFGQEKVVGGLIIAPLCVASEAVIGLMIIRSANNLPCALYRLREPPINALQNEEAIYMKGIENGVVQCFKNASASVGMGIMSAKVNEAIKTLKAFGVNKKVMERMSSQLDSKDVLENYMRCEGMSILLLRLTFRMIASCFPFIRQISIWKVNVGSISSHENNAFTQNNGTKRKNFIRLFNSSKSSKNFSENDEEINGENWEGNSQNYERTILSGYFISEDPNELISTDSEFDLLGLEIEQLQAKKGLSFLVSIPSFILNGHIEYKHIKGDQPSGSKINSKLVHREIVKSVELNHKAFFLSSGHFLVSVDSSSTLHEQFSNLFEGGKSISRHESDRTNDPLPKPPLPKGLRKGDNDLNLTSSAEGQGIHFFFSISAAGIGDYDGFGDIGEKTEKSLVNIFESMTTISDKLFS
jgi:hypothetical protein